MGCMQSDVPRREVSFVSARCGLSGRPRKVESARAMRTTTTGESVPDIPDLLR